MADDHPGEMPEFEYCSVHHPDPEFHAEDKPIIRMNVGIDPEQVLHIRTHSDE